MPAPAPTSSAPSRAMDRWKATAEEHHRAAGQHDAHAEPAAPGQVPDDHRAEADADREADEDGAEEQVERGVAGAQRGGEEVLAVPITMPPPRTRRRCPAPGRGPAGCAPMYFQPSRNWRNMLCSAVRARAPAALAADLLDAEEDHQRGGQPGERVDVERDLHRLGPVGQAADRTAARPAVEGGQRERGQDRRDAVRGDQGELVGDLEPAPCGIRLGTAASLAGIQISVIVSPMKVAMTAQATVSAAGVAEQGDERDRAVEDEPEQVADDHRVAAVEPVGEDTGDRAEQQGRQQPDGDRAAERRALRDAAVTCCGGEERGGEQADPVAEGGDAEHQPEAPERPDAQHGTQRRDPGQVDRSGVLARCSVSMAVPPVITARSTLTGGRRLTGVTHVRVAHK